jgi:anaerobic selenocysteine-containing dehydrogenase/ferredoxin-NADP reductase
MTEKIGFCSLCRSRCGTINVVENGRLIEVRPAPGHPTGRAVCPKGRAAPEIAHSARRLTRPLRRTQPKGSPDPGWTEISWDEALADVAGKLNRYRADHGAETVAFALTSQSSSAIADGTEWVQRLLRLYGSPNNCFATELCNWHKDYGHAYTYGTGLSSPDYRNADLIVLWGHNPANSWLAQAEAIGEARRRGARVISIDPRLTGTARDADQWLGLRPGTDAALALGVARLLIERRQFNRDFVCRWTNGPFLVREDTKQFLRGRDLGWTDDGDTYVCWDGDAPVRASSEQDAKSYALAGTFNVNTLSGALFCRPAFDHYAAACAPYTPEHVAQLTWLTADQVEAMAAAFAGAKRVCYYGWTGIGQHINATQTDRAIAVLHVLTGSFDSPGGNVLFAKHPRNVVNDMNLMAPTQRQKALGLQQRPLGPGLQGWITSQDLYRAMLDGVPYRVRALIGFGANLVVSHPDGRRAREALTALEFHVHCDLFMNPTAEFADIVLPINSPWEREALRVGFEITSDAEELIQLRQRMIEPIGESRSDMQVAFDLGMRLGFEKEFFGGDIAAGWNHILEPTGLTVAELRQHPEGIRLPLTQQHQKFETASVNTDTRRIEIYSELFQRHGYAPVPRFVPPITLSDDFPLVLTTGNTGYFCHSSHRGITALRRRNPEPAVYLHPDLAGQKGIAENDWVAVSSKTGEMRARARIRDGANPRVVAADYGWWEDCPDLGLQGYPPLAPGSSNYNNLVAVDASDPISGALPLRSSACDVRPVSAATWSGHRSFRVHEWREENSKVVSIRLMPADDKPLQHFRPGQYLTLLIDGQSRSYSLSQAFDIDPQTYQITVKDIGGAVSRSIRERLAVGDLVGAMPPTGSFTPARVGPFPVVLMAAGIGITPFMSYLDSLSAAASEPKIVLHYGNRNGSEHVFGARLAEIAKRLPNLTLVNHFTQPLAGDRPDFVGRLSAATIRDDLIRARARFYLCGPEAMMSGITQGLIARGVPRFEIFVERFKSSADPAALTGGPHALRFSRLGKTVTWTPGAGTILACAEAAGLPVASGCRVGQCESCAVPLLAGQVRHLIESPAVDDGLCLTCQAVPLSDVTLDG